MQPAGSPFSALGQNNEKQEASQLFQRKKGFKSQHLYFSQNTLVLGVFLTASTSTEEGHAGNQAIFGPSGGETNHYYYFSLL